MDSEYPTALVQTIAGSVTISRQLLTDAAPTIKMTETESGLEVEASLDDVMSDQLSIMIGLPGRFVHPEPEAPIPPTRRERVRRAVANRLRDIAFRLAEPEDDDDY